MATMKIDGWDVFPYSRVAPGEGMELTDPDLVNPRFTDSTLGEGQPLINFSTGNREILIPVHLSPKWSQGSYANTRDGLNSLAIDLNRACQTAKRFEWKDDAAATSTWFNVQFARFEPDYNYRRVQSRILSGNVHLWTLPYGDTNAERVVASALATGVVLQTPIASVAGDADANINLSLTIGGTTPISGFMREGRIVGYAVVPSGYIVDHPAASLAAGLSPVITAGPDGAGSQYARASASGPQPLVGLRLLSASQYAGKLRLFAIARTELCDDYNVPLTAYYNGVPFSRSNSMASYGGAVRGWSTVDLGVCNVDPLESATAYIQVNVATTLADNYLNFNRLITVPEDKFTLITDFDRNVISKNDFRVATFPTVDLLGNRNITGTLVATNAPSIDINSGLMDSAGSAYLAGFIIDHEPKRDMRIEYGGVNIQAMDVASTAVFIGRFTGSPYTGGTQVHLKCWGNASQLYVNLYSNTSLVASAGLNKPLGGAQAYIEYSIQGSSAYGLIRTASLVATAAHIGAQEYSRDLGRAFFQNVSSIGVSFNVGDWMNVTENASRAMNLGDQYHWNASTVTKTSSIGMTRMEMFSRGPALKMSPGKYQDIAVFNLPLDGEPTTDFLAVDCRISERFTFSR